MQVRFIATYWVKMIRPDSSAGGGINVIDLKAGLGHALSLQKLRVSEGQVYAGLLATGAGCMPFERAGAPMMGTRAAVELYTDFANRQT